MMSKLVCQSCYASAGWAWEDNDEKEWVDGYIRCRALDEINIETGDVEVTLHYVGLTAPKKCFYLLEHILAE